MALANLLFFSVATLFLLLLVLLIFIGYRSWVYKTFNTIFVLVLVLILLFALFSPYAEPVELTITNYSSKKGNLFFFTEEGCDAIVRYDFPISANEESKLEIERPKEGGFRQILFASEKNDSLFRVPVPKKGVTALDIWEKELQAADNCYRAQLQEYQWGQKKFSYSIGILLAGLLLLFWCRWNKQRSLKSSGL